MTDVKKKWSHPQEICVPGGGMILALFGGSSPIPHVMHTRRDRTLQRDIKEGMDHIHPAVISG